MVKFSIYLNRRVFVMEFIFKLAFGMAIIDKSV